MGKVKTNLKTRRHTFIKEWRKAMPGLTQERLADRIGVTVGTISQLEAGQINYTQPMLEALADALGCEPADLITRLPGQKRDLEVVWNKIPANMQEIALAALKAFIPKDGTNG